MIEQDLGHQLLLGQKLWWKKGWGRRDMGCFITDNDYEVRKREQKRLKKEHKEAQKAYNEACRVVKRIEKADSEAKPEYHGEKGSSEWEAANKRKQELYWKHRHLEEDIRKNDVKDYKQFNPSDVYYDDMNDQLEEMIKQYNRLAFILQGLFDRSEVFHPHPPVQLWTPEGMDAALKMVRDDDHALHAGEKPDIEAYLAENRKHLEDGCHTIGQELFWAEKEAVKENRRTANSWREERTYHDTYHPYGNPGPGYIAKVVKMTKRSHKCTYEWDRQRQTSGWVGSEWKRYGDPIPCKIQVPPERLFVVEAYTPGDYKKFFADPRTRCEYLEWAPLLLAAEEWHAGNMAEGTEYPRASLRKGLKVKGKLEEPAEPCDWDEDDFS